MSDEKSIFSNSFENSVLFDSMKYFYEPIKLQETDTLEFGKSFRGRKRKKQKRQKECKIKAKEPIKLML